MATGGFKPNAPTDFLEEWKAKREKMRAKMLGDIAAATGGLNNAVTGAIVGATAPGKDNNRHNAPPQLPLPTGTEFSRHANPERSASYSVSRSSSGSALKQRSEEEITAAHHQQQYHPPPPPPPPSTTPQMDIKGAQCSSSPETFCGPPPPPPMITMACNNNDSDTNKESSPSSSPAKAKGEKSSSSGPSARKGKGQIEKRKLREKRRSTGVVSIPSNESLDELEDEDTGERSRRQEEQLVQANTVQNEAMTADPATGLLLETHRSGSGRHKSSAGPGSEEEAGGSRQRHGRQRDGAGGLERRMEELEKELCLEREQSMRLLKAHEDKDDLIAKLKEEIDLLNRDLDDIEDECEQLKQENKTLLKVVGQLTR